MTLFTTPVRIPENALAMMANGGSAVSLTEPEAKALLTVSPRWAAANADLARALGIDLPAALPVVVEPEPETVEPEVEVLKPLPKKKPGPVLTVATDGRDTLVNYYPHRA